jgi:Glycosyl transferase family 2/Glycosyl transferase 4-like domain
MEFLERVFDSLADQRCALPWDVHVIDSGSTDGTPEFLERIAPGFPVPLTVRRIPQEQFDHGDTRNELAARSRGELVVLLTQDAIPSSPDWLDLLARNFEDAHVGAVTCRNVPRADALPLTRIFSSCDPGYGSERTVTRCPEPEQLARMTADEHRLLYNFNDVASAIRRELWERHPFPRTMMGEDVLMGRAIVLAGHSIVYDADATVDHSHDYGPEKMRWRGGVDARFNAEYLGRICVATEDDKHALTRDLVAGDLRAIEEDRGIPPAQREALGARALELREAFVEGLYEGGLARTRFSATAMLESADLHILYVVGSSAALEAGTGSPWRADLLARTMGARGHRVTVHAVPRQTTAQAAERAFATLLATETPDVVHFLGLPSQTVCLARATRLQGIPTVISVDAQVLDQLSAERPDAQEHGAATSALSAVLRNSALCLVADRALREELLAAGCFRPRRLVTSEPDRESQPGLPGDPFGSKTLAQTAAELEYRYRGLACILDPANVQWEALLESTGRDALRTTGRCEPQSASMLLLRPGSSAEYGFPAAAAGPVRIELEQFQFSTERAIVLGGSVYAGGLRLGTIPASRADSLDGVVRHAFEAVLPEGTRSLALKSSRRFSLRKRFLRIGRLTVTSMLERPEPPGASYSPYLAKASSSSTCSRPSTSRTQRSSFTK